MTTVPASSASSASSSSSRSHSPFPPTTTTTRPGNRAINRYSTTNSAEGLAGAKSGDLDSDGGGDAVLRGAVGGDSDVDGGDDVDDDRFATGVGAGVRGVSASLARKATGLDDSPTRSRERLWTDGSRELTDCVDDDSAQADLSTASSFTTTAPMVRSAASSTASAARTLSPSRPPSSPPRRATPSRKAQRSSPVQSSIPDPSISSKGPKPPIYPAFKSMPPQSSSSRAFFSIPSSQPAAFTSTLNSSSSTLPHLRSRHTHHLSSAPADGLPPPQSQDPTERPRPPPLSDPLFILHYVPRALLLFALGFLFAVIIDHLQKEHNITRYPPNIPKLFSSASWMPLCCGFAGCLVGTLYPYLDTFFLQRPQRLRREWSSVIRCCGGFIGVNYAASKLPWTSSVQVSLTLALLAVGLWFLFDRTWHGFVISAVFATVGTWIGFLLVSNGAYRWTQADFFGMRSWLPCILYSSCVCFGSIGRQLAVFPDTATALEQNHRVRHVQPIPSTMLKKDQ